jgi:hypothetical protein
MSKRTQIKHTKGKRAPVVRETATQMVSQPDDTRYKVNVVFKNSPWDYQLSHYPGECRIPVQAELFCILATISNIVKHFVWKFLELKNGSKDIKLFGGAMLHILADAMGRKMPLNDLDFMVEVDETDFKTVLPKINMLRFVSQLLLNKFPVSIIKITPYSTAYKNTVCKFSVELNDIVYFFDVVFSCKDKPSTLDGLPITAITMNFDYSMATIEISEEEQYWNLAQLNRNKQLSFPRLYEIMTKLRDTTSYEMRSIIHQVERCFLVVCKTIRKGIKLNGIYEGTCIICGGSSDEMKEEEQFMRKLLVPLCQNAVTNADSHSMCMFCFLSSITTEKKFPRCLSHCTFDDDKYSSLFVTKIPTKATFLGLPFDWNILRRTEFKPKVQKEVSQDNFTSLFKDLCIEACSVIPSDQRTWQIQQDHHTAQMMEQQVSAMSADDSDDESDDD